MSRPRTKLTARGHAKVPAAILHPLGWAPGDVLAWALDGDEVVLRRVSGYTSEDIHRAVFLVPPTRRNLGELKRGIRDHVGARRARG